ncbi:hypothetical protein Dimus_009202 [Dionaea muscipula]
MSTSNRVSQFSDLIQRVTSSCLLHPLGANRSFDPHQIRGEGEDEDDTDEGKEEEEGLQSSDDDDEEGGEAIENDLRHNKESGSSKEEVVGRGEATELVALMGQVFDAVSSVKRAYASLQEAHNPWDPEKMRVADAAIVAELRRLGMMRERLKRGFGGGGGVRSISRGGKVVAETVREVVAPYEAAVEELKREVKAKEAEVENLREKLNSAVNVRGGGGGGGGAGGGNKRSQSRRKVGCIQGQVPLSPLPELFEAAMVQVTEASKSFTSLLLSLMRSAHWDIAAAVRSIEAAITANDPISPTPAAAAHHGKYAIESYVCRKIFQGFDHESFYMDGTLSSLLNPDQFRRDCFSKYRDMKSIDPAELLGILPTCQFGVFCNKRYLSIVHPKMEESLFGDMEQQRQVLAGSHPRTQFYGEFLRLAKAVWLLHLLAFSLDPPPSHFEASRGAEFHPVYMESVVGFTGGKVPPGHVVGFSISPGFKLGSGSVIKARVYVVPHV